MNFFKCRTVAWAEQRIHFRFKPRSLLLLHSRQMLTWERKTGWQASWGEGGGRRGACYVAQRLLEKLLIPVNVTTLALWNQKSVLASTLWKRALLCYIHIILKSVYRFVKYNLTLLILFYEHSTSKWIWELFIHCSHSAGLRGKWTQTAAPSWASPRAPSHGLCRALCWRDEEEHAASRDRHAWLCMNVPRKAL